MANESRMILADDGGNSKQIPQSLIQTLSPPRPMMFTTTVAVATLFLFCQLLVCVISSDGVGGSCSVAKLCCLGRDSSCVIQKTWVKLDRSIEVANEKPCYCDHACLKLGDCCADFKKTCKAADCVVSVWGNWSTCDANCGTGMMRRTRTIIKHPTNGGKHCPPLIQRRACLGTSCPQNPSSALKEIAMLLPISTAPVQTATLSNSNQITRKLGGGKANANMSYDSGSASFLLENQIEAPSHRYCVRFKVVTAAKACKKQVSFSALNEGEKVCVQCDGEAIRPSLGYRCAGHGTTDRSTSWSVLSAPHCHGKWVRLDASSTTMSSSAVIGSGTAVAKFETIFRPAAVSAATACLHLCPEGPRFVFV